MFQRLLVANRGEIACRILRTAHRMGIGTVAVYSDADLGARHVRHAERAVRIGPAPAARSYLDIEAIIAAARASGAEAIHPGYGFLSENARFAAACRDAGLIFVGPDPQAIEAMGSKSLAKARVRAAGVPVLPGYEGERQDLPFIEARALEAGLPLMVKPAAGGGGKGMHVVQTEKELRAALEAARRLAESSFGDGTLLVERFVPEPRHIEVQVFADRHGRCIHLGDRDCSVQRRHQKLIEEAPAPALPAPLREQLRAAAVTVARDIGYVGAGTVEFLFDGREFYFLEMNTRLQVEHTVTEAVTGVDLVEWQLRIAAGQPLPLSQQDVRLEGHAIEARVCAEDPWRGFLPSAGTLRSAAWPDEAGVRVDTGFDSGDTVPAAYDSLIAKVIAWAPERAGAAAVLAGALERTDLAGVRTNERWLSRILRSSVFLEARHSVALLTEQGEAFTVAEPPTDAALALAALAAYADGPHAHPWSAQDGFRPNRAAFAEVTLGIGGRTHRLRVRSEGAVPVEVLMCPESDQSAAEARRMSLADVQWTASTLEARIDTLRERARFLRDGERLHLWLGAVHHEFDLDDPRRRAFTATLETGGLTTPLPGVVAAVNVEEGQQVHSGETLMVIEAMKMEHGISAPFDGRVTRIHFALGDRVPEGSELLALSPLDDADS